MRQESPPRAVALALARFVQALWVLDATDGPPPDEFNAFRGVPLAARDAQVRRALAELRKAHDGLLDTEAAQAAWEEALAAPAWEGPPRWIHGDLQPANLLMRRGRLQAVIDFGCMGVGDPACDLQVAWNFLSGESRDVFRKALGVDGATWARGRGWALSVGLIALPYYRETNPLLAGIARHTIEEVAGL
jgi:aminoglycoside phosphotransferase (APT) family kinase protein